MKKELLAPAGNMEAAYAAINNGADALYLSGTSFGARAFAQNFSNEEIYEIIRYAHLLGVKIYVTVNTLIENTDFTNITNYIKDLHKNNVDAIIVQDIGLASYIHKKFPNLEMHASTQMHNIDTYSCNFLEELGFKRVVMARETSIKEINDINTSLDIEAFIHGALCISYSGQCLFSSMAMNRSGNKGACSQLCRMPYEFKVDNTTVPKSGKYLLSPKDLCTANDFDEIMKSNIHSLKIEGRMKSSTYVGVTTRMYRKLIDAYYNNTKADVTKELILLEVLFNRGYTKGYILSTNDLMNTLRGNHKGVEVGTVTNVNDKYITIKLNDTIKIKDGIKFEKSDKGMKLFNIYINNIEVKTANSGATITIPNNVKLDILDKVLLTYSDEVESMYKEFDTKKIDITMKLSALINEKLTLQVSDGTNTITMDSDIVESASNKEVTSEDIISKLSKINDTVYKLKDINIKKSDNIFIRLSTINNLRRTCIEALDEKRLQTNTIFKEESIDKIDSTNNKSDNNLFVMLRNMDQYDIISKYNINTYITDNYELYTKLKSTTNIYYEVLLNDNKEYTNESLLLNSTSDINRYSNNNKVILNYTLNTTNKYTLSYLNNFGNSTISVESSFDYLKNNASTLSSGILFIYGKVRVMSLKHCLLHSTKCCDTCKHQNTSKTLVDAFSRECSITCKYGINYIYNHKPILKIRDIKEYIEKGYNNHRIDFLDESPYEINKILKEYFSIVL